MVTTTDNGLIFYGQAETPTPIYDGRKKKN